jgi:DNA-binding response OmpR family regulator
MGLPYVLVVEDEKGVNALLCRFIEFAGFAARSAPDGATALHTAREQSPILVLLDLMLPDTTGFDVCTELKGDEQTRAAPVIVMSALQDEASRRRAIDCGAIEYILKPFDGDTLIDTVKRHASPRSAACCEQRRTA